MGNALQNTNWPSIAILSDGKDLIGKFFSLVDLPDPHSGRILAEEVFAEDGVFVAVSNKSFGSEGTYSATGQTSLCKIRTSANE